MSILTRRVGWRKVLALPVILLILLLIGSCLGVSGARLLHYFYPWLPRAQVLALFAELDWGMEIQDVQEVLQSDRYTELRAGPDNAIREGVWPIYTPNELLENNWVLWLQFDEGILTAKRIRIADWGKGHPIEAFDDEMAHADVPCPGWLEIREDTERGLVCFGKSVPRSSHPRGPRALRPFKVTD